MKIISQASSTIREDTYVLEVENLYFGSEPKTQKITYVEFINDKGKLTDCIMRNEGGEEIDNPELLNRIQNFIDALPPGK